MAQVPGDVKRSRVLVVSLVDIHLAGMPRLEEYAGDICMAFLTADEQCSGAVLGSLVDIHIVVTIRPQEYPDNIHMAFVTAGVPISMPARSIYTHVYTPACSAVPGYI